MLFWRLKRSPPGLWVEHQLKGSSLLPWTRQQEERPRQLVVLEDFPMPSRNNLLGLWGSKEYLLFQGCKWSNQVAGKHVFMVGLLLE